MMEVTLSFKIPSGCLLATAKTVKAPVSVIVSHQQGLAINHIIKIESGNVRSSSVKKILGKYSEGRAGITYVGKRFIISDVKTPICNLYSSVADSGCFLISEKSIDGNRCLARIIAPRRTNLKRLIRSLKKLDDSVKVIKLVKVGGTAYLTSRQEELLLKALAVGYFEYPRKRSLKAIASELGISPSTLSENMRSIIRKIVQRYVSDEQLFFQSPFWDS